jgi:hypothetical protein
MWIDENGAVHTVWVPPQDVLGENTVAALRALPPKVRASAQAELDGRFDDVLNAVTRDSPHGPADLPDAHDPGENACTAPPPLVPGLVPRPDEPLATTVLAWLEKVPSQWRLEALEAVVELLDGPTSDGGI